MDTNKKYNITEEDLLDLAGAYMEYDTDEFGDASDDLEDYKARVIKALDGSGLGVMYTNVGANNEHDLQVDYDLLACRLVGYFDWEEVISDDMDDLHAIAEELRYMTWEDYYSWITDAPEVQHAQEVEDLECEICWLFNGHHNPATSGDLAAAYVQKSGDMEPFDQGRAGDWCIAHNDDLGDEKMRKALNAYYEATEEDEQ